MFAAKNIVVAQTLAGTGAPAERWMEPHGCLQTVQDHPAPGFVRNVMLGVEGLQIRHGDYLVAIPMALLLAHAESLQPELRPPAPKQLEADARENQQLVEVVTKPK